jgi:hypothetical protein
MGFLFRRIIMDKNKYNIEYYGRNKIGILERLKIAYREKHPKKINDLYNPQTEKMCGKCKKIKPLSDFFLKTKQSKDKYQYQCKECCKKQGEKYRQEHNEDINKHQREIYNTVLGKEIYKRKHEKCIEKRKAQYAVQGAVRSNKIQPAKNYICVVCNTNQAKDWHHHKGYDKENWLDVIPVCGKCHYRINAHHDVEPK